MFAVLKPPQVGQTCIGSFMAVFCRHPLQARVFVRQHKIIIRLQKLLVIKGEEWMWQASGTFKWRKRQLEVRKVLYRRATLAPWCLHSLTLLHWCKAWLWPTVIRGAWVSIPRVNPGRFLHGSTSLNMLFQWTGQTFRIQPSWFHWVSFSYFSLSSLRYL